MSTRTNTEVRLPTACRVLIEGKPVYLAEPSYDEVAKALVDFDQVHIDPTIVASRYLDAVTTGASKTKIDLTLVTGLVAEPDEARLEAHVASQVIEPELDLDPTEFRVKLEGKLATLSVMEPIGVGQFVEVVQDVNLDTGQVGFVNPAFEGNVDAVVKALRGIAVEEQRHVDALTAEYPKTGDVGVTGDVERVAGDAGAAAIPSAAEQGDPNAGQGGL